MPELQRFYELLFEVSNEYRHRILILLQGKALRLTDLTTELGVTAPEARRHIARLREVELIQRNSDGWYNLTPYGETCLFLFREFSFLSVNREYFLTHILSKIPNAFVKQIGELKSSTNFSNPMDFLRHTEILIKESTEYVWLIVDQFPMYSVSTIVEAIKRGVEFRIIEHKERIFNTDLDVMTSEETQALGLTRSAHLVEQRLVDDVGTYLFLSDSRCVIAFPTTDGSYDYKGFMSSDDSSLKWCMKLFQHYWDEAEHRTQAPPALQVKRGELQGKGGTASRKVVIGRARPEFDAQAIQSAVDNYDEVILNGSFNLGTLTVYINRSVVLRGEGREKDTPTTKIRKQGWTFPSYNPEHLLVVSGEGIDVTIENIHFTDFNYCCIRNRLGNSVKIRNNRITLGTGRGRGVSMSNREAQVIGILSSGTQGGFPGDILIEGNYLDFDLAHLVGGFYTRKGLMTDPNYRPDLQNHESYCGVGIAINFNSGSVIVRDNIIRNMNSRGILIMDNHESADIHIVDNTIVSDIYGAYPFSSHIAGIGIQAQSSWAFPLSDTCVEISGNEIKCNKLNYCGIAIYGLSMYQEGAGKLGKCVVKDNNIHLEDGHVGVLIRKNDGTEVYGNRISGRAYYGFHLWGSEDRKGFDLGSNDNVIENNDFSDLRIKIPDEYSDSHVDGRMFTGTENKSKTAHVWLNKYSRSNVVKIKENESIIDEGENNTIST